MPPLRVVDVALHLARRDRRRARCGRRGSAASRRSPSTTGSSSPRSARGVRYSTKPSPSRSPYSSIHASARERGLAQLVDERRVVRPAPDLREQDEEERRRVDRAVVAREPVRRGLARAAPRGRSCPARRRSTGRPRSPAASASTSQRRARELGPEEQRLQARDQRVAAEDGHEPRHPGGGQLAVTRVVRRRIRSDARSVTDWPNGCSSASQLGAQLRHAQLPGGERVARRARAPRRSWRSTACGARSAVTVDAEARRRCAAPSARAARARRRSAIARARRRRRAREKITCVRAVAVGIREHELVVSRVDAARRPASAAASRARGRRARSRAP